MTCGANQNALFAITVLRRGASSKGGLYEHYNHISFFIDDDFLRLFIRDIIMNRATSLMVTIQSGQLLIKEPQTLIIISGGIGIEYSSRSSLLLIYWTTINFCFLFNWWSIIILVIVIKISFHSFGGWLLTFSNLETLLIIIGTVSFLKVIKCAKNKWCSFIVFQSLLFVSTEGEEVF